MQETRRKWYLKRLWMEFLDNGRITNLFHIFSSLSGTIGATNLPDMTSPAASSQLQNAIEYCTKVRKTVEAGTVEYVSHSLTQNYQI